MSIPIILADDVHKSYGRGQTRFDALKGVSFAISEGESIAILGKSGSGKSTLMHIMALLDAPSSGRIKLENVDTRTLKGRRLNRTRNKTFGFVFQQFFLIPNASVLDNVTLPLKIAGGRSAGSLCRNGPQPVSSFLKFDCLPPLPPPYS